MVSRHSARDNQWLHASPSIPQQQQQQRHPSHHHQQQYQCHSRESSINSSSANNNYYHHSKSHSYPDLISSPGQPQQHSPSSFHSHHNSYNSRISPQAHFSSPGSYKAEPNSMLSHQVSPFEGSPTLNSRPGHHHQQQHGGAQYHPSSRQQQQMYHQQAHGGVLAKPQQQRSLSGGNINTANNNVKRRIPKEKAPKGDREEVWPPEVESAFMKALEVLPKLGRRKVLVNGKPCGRNELIADFIYQETGKVRDRKQVSSHIQVLKNTRKNDPEFMKLLLDVGDGDEDMGPESTTNIGYLSSSQSPNGTPQLQNDPLESTLFDSRGMQHHLSHDPSSPLSAHPHGQDGYGSYAESLNTSSSAYYRQQQQQQFHGSSSGVMDPTASDHLYDDQTSVTTPDSAISLSSHHSVQDPTTFAMLDPLSKEPLHLSNTHTPDDRQRDLFRSPPPPPMPHHYSQHSQEPSYPLWPTVFRLFTQYLSAENKHHHFSSNDYNSPPTSGVQIHDLARLQDMNLNSFGTINIHHLPSEKFPHLLDLYQKVACEFLLFKINMNLDLELEGGTFENSCLFESNDPHRTVRCSTSIYSFGAKVLESTEIKQGNGGAVAMAGGGGIQKGGMGFQFVNQFFTAFLNGIRTLGTLDEVQVALSNLSIVQIYEEVDPVAVASGAAAAGAAGVAGGGSGAENGGSPLLVMAFEFQQGGGSVVPYFVTEGLDMLDSIMC